jgi:hypothetical protein
LCLGHFVMGCFVCVSCGRLEGITRHCPLFSLCAVYGRLEVGVIVICSVCLLSGRLGGRLDGRRHCPVFSFYALWESGRM